MSTAAEKPNTTYYYSYEVGRGRRRQRKPMRAYSADPVQRKRQIAEKPREGVLNAATNALCYGLDPAPFAD